MYHHRCANSCVWSENTEGDADATRSSPRNTTTPKRPGGVDIRCSLFNTTQKVCMKKIAADDLDGVLECDCPLPCRETQYRSQVTSTRANMLHYELLHKLRKNVASFCSDKMDTVVLHVYLDSISYELIDESPTYTWDTLLCNLGGSLGLFVGVSMLSILEVLELLVDLCILTFSQKKRGRKDKKEWNQDEGELVKVQTQGEKNVNFAWVLEGSVGKCSAKCASQTELQVLREELQHLKMAFARRSAGLHPAVYGILAQLDNHPALTPSHPAPPAITRSRTPTPRQLESRRQISQHFRVAAAVVKRGQTEDHVPPTLEPKTAVSILISADFLKMAPLVEEVLQYVHDNINLILEAQVNLSCLSDAILTRLAYLFTHWELESLRDRRQNQNKLYAKFLQGLCEAYPSPARGIFKTASTLYRQGKNSRGKLFGDPGVSSITNYWRVHRVWKPRDSGRGAPGGLRARQYLHHTTTDKYTSYRAPLAALSSGSEMKFCRHQPPRRRFSDVDLLLASDTYPCCGARALKFSPLPVRNVRCLASDHTVQLSQGESDIWGPIPLIYDDLLTFQLLVCIDPPYQLTPESKNVLWTGVPLVPPNKAERSFLDRSWLAHFSHGERDSHAAVRPGLPENTAAAATTGVNLGVGTGVSSESSSDEEEGGGRPGLTPRLRANLMRRANRARRSVNCEVMAEPSLRWDSGRSTRHNQDAQREKETRLLRDLRRGSPWRPPTPTTRATAPTRDTAGVRTADASARTAPTPASTTGWNPSGTFRAKVQAISRIKMRLRHRAAFSASR
ncbi:hypothetical protein C7M84_010752 [Penaeus vannamei]|uniref:Uncharacterized protein n=1 Tax=Penaeus vannamei TaxID=6689 RepID=A0A3R7PGE2_PENVA|nr:hypothetical protein C7M84_010752 [Penaeus vannamei]